jgi:hypothetical protein
MIKRKEVSTMAITQEIKKKKKATVTATRPKTKVKKEKILSVPEQKAKTTEELNPISKSKEWRLLYVPYPFRNTGNNVSPAVGSGFRSRGTKKDTGKYKGLCKNCKKRKTCTLPKPDGGLWRCEEYE